MRERLFVDMDGTLAVFKPVDTLETLYEEGYFLNLQPHDNVVDMVKEFIANHPDVEVFIMSAVLSDSEYALNEKNEWLDKYLPEIDAAHRVFPPCGVDKKEYVPGGIRPTDFLLDDYTKNLTLWQPPAKGIKLLNGINHTRGTWQHDCLSFEKSGKELVADIVDIMKHGAKIKDMVPQEKDKEPWQTSLTYDYRTDVDAIKLVAAYEYMNGLYAGQTYTRYEGYNDLWEVKWGVSESLFKERVNAALTEFNLTYREWKNSGLAHLEKFDDIKKAISKNDVAPEPFCPRKRGR